MNTLKFVERARHVFYKIILDCNEGQTYAV